LAIVLAVWSLSSVFVKYLIREGYDAHTQNFYRYAAGTLVMAPFLVRHARQSSGRTNRRLLLLLLVATVPNLCHQISWTVSLNWINPGLAAFLNKSSVLFAAVLAFALYAEERWLLRSRRFMTGLALTLLGTVGLALLRGDLDKMEANLGVALALFAGMSWATYSVVVKRPAAELGSMVAFGIVGVYTTVVLLLVALRWGNLGQWNRVPWHVNVILIVSGILCIGIGHSFYYYAMQRLTVSVCATVLLTSPLGTLLISYFLFGETMTAGQILSGLALIVGGVLTLLAKDKGMSPVLAQATEAADA